MKAKGKYGRNAYNHSVSGGLFHYNRVPNKTIQLWHIDNNKGEFSKQIHC